VLPVKYRKNTSAFSLFRWESAFFSRVLTRLIARAIRETALAASFPLVDPQRNSKSGLCVIKDKALQRSIFTVFFFFSLSQQ
jgi:hypothetical protein